MRFAPPAAPHSAEILPDAPMRVMPSLPIGLVYLQRWPELPTQLNAHELLVNRICTLLSNKPRASHLIHLLLRAPKEEVHMALCTLLQSGCVHIGQASTVPGTGAASLRPTAAPRKNSRKPRSPAPAPQPESMLGKLWTKISG